MIAVSKNDLSARLQNDHLNTDHLRTSIKTRTVSGGIVRATAQGCQLVLTLAYNVVLARLLSPQDFGLYFMATTAAGFLRVFKDAGLSTVTIQREEINHEQVSNLFWVNLAVSATISLLMIATAPVVALFFRQPPLVEIAVALSIGFLFDGLAVQHIALLNRKMRFTAISVIEIGSLTVGFVIGILMALRDWGYWSLVAATLSTAVVRLISAWIVMPWRPQGFRKKSGTRSLVSFGADLTAVGLIYALSRGCDSVLIGRFLGSEAVGLYSRATTLFSRPMEQLTAPAYSAVGPALSRLQSEPERYRRIFLQIFEGLVLAGFLFTAVFVPLSYPLITVVLGHKWEAAAPIFAGLALAAFFYPQANAASWLYITQGRGRDFVRTTIITAVVMVVSFAIGLPFGPTGVALSYSLSGIFIFVPLTFHVGGQKGPVSSRDLWGAFTRHLPASLVTFGSTLLATTLTAHYGALLQLVISGLVSLIACAGSIILFSPSRRAVQRILGVVAELRNR